jgi:hypothetical protein
MIRHGMGPAGTPQCYCNGFCGLETKDSHKCGQHFGNLPHQTLWGGSCSPSFSRKNRDRALRLSGPESRSITMSKVASLVLIGFVAPVAFISSIVTPSDSATRAGRQSECEPRRGRNVAELLPCAWKMAQQEIGRRYPDVAMAITQLKRPDVGFRNGPWFDEEDGYVDGDTDLDNDPPITLGITGDTVYDYHTAIHEYKHAIIDMLGLGEAAQKWVDSEDDDPPDERT